LLEKLRSGGLWFEAIVGKKFVRPSSQPTAGHSGTFLPSQLYKSQDERIVVLDQPGQKCSGDPISTEKKLNVVQMCVILFVAKSINWKIVVQGLVWTKSEILYPKQPKQKGLEVYLKQ
jgi:hypothetical protein